MKNTRNLMAAAMMLATLANGVVPAMAAEVDVPADTLTTNSADGGVSTYDYVVGPTRVNTTDKVRSFSLPCSNEGNWASAAFYNTGSTTVYLNINWPAYADSDTAVVEPGEIQVVRLKDSTGNGFNDIMEVVLERAGSSGRIQGDLYRYNGPSSLGIFDYLPHI